MTIEVLVTTMHATGFEKFYEMNIQTDMIIANQADRWEYQETEINGCKVRMITSNTRGSSINRNIALSCATADCVIFADDDMVFVNNYLDIIEYAFKRKEISAVRFNYKTDSESRLGRNVPNVSKGKLKNLMSSGVCGLAVRRNEILKYNLLFPIGYGPGCDVYMGEDSIFIKKMLDSLKNIYCSNEYIATISMNESSWYEGITPKYLYNTGYVNGVLYGRWAYLNLIRRAYKLSRSAESNFSFSEVIKLMYQGLQQYYK